MSERSTGYVFGFAAGVCLACAVVVSASVVVLKERQEKNKVLDKQKKVLSVAGLIDEGEAPEASTVASLFEERIEARVVHLEDGSYVPDIEATTYDQRSAAKDPATSEKAPDNPAKVARIPNNALVFHVMKDDVVDKIILPIEGKGLWSTLYGFIALERDTTTIAGITFYEHGETPGLGGEVDNPVWKGLWKGRKAFGEDWNPQIEVVKGSAGSPSEAPHKVDGLSGATLTSRGVTYLVQFWLGENGFGPYLENFRKEAK